VLSPVEEEEEEEEGKDDHDQSHDNSHHLKLVMTEMRSTSWLDGRTETERTGVRPKQL
jgi:hypothetical protein